MIRVKYNLKAMVTSEMSAKEKKELREFRPGYLHPGMDVDNDTGNAYLLISEEKTGAFFVIPITDVFRDTNCTQGETAMITNELYGIADDVQFIRDCQ